MTEQTTTDQPAKMTGQEVANSLTGFDEIAIRQQFGASLDQLDPITVARACGFTLQRRTGQSDRDAYQTVMEMPQGQLQTLFATDDEVPDDDRSLDPVSPAGKGSEPSVTSTTSAPPSAS